MRNLFLSLLLLFPLIAKAQWTDEQKILGGVALTVMVIDYGQTRQIALHPEKWTELNPLLPKKPSLADINRHFIIIPIVTYVALDHLPSEYRTVALYVITAMQVAVVANNYRIGVRISF